MKKCLYLLILLSILPFSNSKGKDYLLSTNKTSLLITATKDKKPEFQYYGTRIEEKDIPSIYSSQIALHKDSYPVFGIRSAGEKSMIVTHPDGNMSLDLVLESVNQTETNEGNLTELVMVDKRYPFQLTQYFKVYKNTDVISTWVEIMNQSKKDITLHKFASAYIPMYRYDNWLTHFHGEWAAENMMSEEQLFNGQKIIANKEGIRNTQKDNPSFMLSIGGRATENTGSVMGAVLAWSGNYKLKFDITNSYIDLIAGINEDASHYILGAKKSFVTPEFAMSYSNEGKGGISRAFHRWARQYKLYHGNNERDILLNSWEGVYFKVNQESMEQMMDDFSAMGGELFVMDDGWFGDKYPRNNDKTSLGDWTVCKEKLPKGIDELIHHANQKNLKFGIWIEPEMANTHSELFEKHPEWVLSQDNRPLSTSRGQTQVVLDLTNPKVQDFVFSVVDKLLTTYPQIAYIKWDANSELMNYGSHYLTQEKQSHIYIDYHEGLINVLKKIRNKYPDVVMQACASGGGRINYGVLPYFDEFWTSDNTDALQRIYMQWGVSHFYPAIAMASHVSSSKNHQTGRIIPIKFRFDVAMTGRLGMEIQPKDMSEEDKQFAKTAIAAYKQIRPIIQFGNQYRLVSPFDNKGIASLLYVDDKKDEAVFFAYKISYLRNMENHRIQIIGLDENKMYQITDLTPDGKPCSLNGKILSGRLLCKEGIRLNRFLQREYASLALKLTAVK